MEVNKPELRGNLYNQSFRSGHKKKSIQTSQTIPDILPNINQTIITEKANVVRNQVNNTKEQIVEMEAKLKKLRKIKEKYQSQKQHNLTKIYFMNNVKQRVRNDQQYKERVRQIKNQSLQELKSQVGQLRESLVRQKRNAEDNLLQTKIYAAGQERRRKKHHEFLIQKLKELERLEKNQKVQKVKEFEEQSASRMRQFQTSRVTFSKENYHKKVLSALKQREFASRTLSRMKEQEQKLKNLVKQSQKQMLTSLYSLQTLNPEKKRRSASHFNQTQKSQKSLKIDLDNYESEQFES